MSVENTYHMHALPLQQQTAPQPEQQQVYLVIILKSQLYYSFYIAILHF